MINADDLHHITPRWTEAPHVAIGRDPLARVVREDDGSLSAMISFYTEDRRRAVFSFPCIVGDARTEPVRGDDNSRQLRWGLRRLGLGVWTVYPAVRQPGAFYAYITIVDVPEPPPWEQVPGDPS